MKVLEESHYYENGDTIRFTLADKHEYIGKIVSREIQDFRVISYSVNKISRVDSTRPKEKHTIQVVLIEHIIGCYVGNPNSPEMITNPMHNANQIAKMTNQVIKLKEKNINMVHSNNKLKREIKALKKKLEKLEPTQPNRIKILIDGKELLIPPMVEEKVMLDKLAKAGYQVQGEKTLADELRENGYVLDGDVDKCMDCQHYDNKKEKCVVIKSARHLVCDVRKYQSVCNNCTNFVATGDGSTGGMCKVTNSPKTRLMGCDVFDNKHDAKDMTK